jgi:hypothetical protein
MPPQKPAVAWALDSSELADRAEPANAAVAQINTANLTLAPVFTMIPPLHACD